MTIAVFGPTCAGKSTFIRDCLGVSAEDIIFAHQLGCRVPGPGQTIHYNLLVGATHAAAVETARPAALVDLPRLNHMLGSIRLVACYVLHCPQDELIARAKARRVVEIGDERGYPSQVWVERLQLVDLSALYNLLAKTLQTHGISPTRVNTAGRLAA